VLDEQHVAGVQLALADRERADDVVGDHAAGVAQHVDLPEVRPEQGEDVDSGVHARHDGGVQRGRHREPLGARRGEPSTARFVPPDQFVRTHGNN